MAASTHKKSKKQRKTARPQPAAAAAPPAKPKRRVKRYAACGLLSLIGLAWAAPIIVAHTPLRNQALASLAGGLQGSVTADGASLGWFSPVTLYNVELRDKHGQTVLQIPTLRVDRSLRALVFDRAEIGHVWADHPQIFLKVSEDGSNLENVLEAFLDGNDDHTLTCPRLDVQVAEGVINVEDTRNNRRFRLERIDGVVDLARDWSAPMKVEGSATVAQPDRALRVDVRLEMSRHRATKTTTVSEGRLNVKTGNFPLEMAQTLVQRFSPQTEVSGWLTGDAAYNWGVDQDDRPYATIETRLFGERLALVTPELGRDALRLAKLEAPGRLTWQDGKLGVQELSLTCDVGNLAVTGNPQLDLGRPPLQALLEAARTQNFQLRGKLDLAKLAELLPETLHIRQDAEIRTGNIDVSLSRQAKPGGATWQGHLNTAELTALRHGELLSWKNPINITFTAHEQPHGPVLDRLECKSEFLSFEAAGSQESFSASAEYDLRRLADQLNHFVELGDLRLDGGGWSYLTWKREPNGGFETEFQGAVQNFEVTIPDRRSWKEPNLFVLLSGAGDLRDTAVGSLREAALRLESGKDILTAELTSPVSDIRLEADWPLKATLNGDLQHWLARLEPLTGPCKELQLRGNCDLKAGGVFSPRVVKIDSSEGVVKDFHAQYPGWDIQEPKWDFQLSGLWRPTERRVELTKANVAGATVRLDADHASLAFPHDSEPQLAGKIGFSADLAPLLRWRTPASQGPACRLEGQAAGRATLAPDGPRTKIELYSWAKNLTFTTAAGARHVEPDASMTATGSYHRQNDTLLLDKLLVACECLKADAHGSLAGVAGQQVLELQGDADYDVDKLLALLQSYTGDRVKVVAARCSRPFYIKGPLPSLADDKTWLHEFTALASADWTGADVYGFRVGAGAIQANLSNGELRLAPLDLAVSGGRLTATPRIVLWEQQPALELPKGRLLEKIQISEAMCNQGLRYIAPLVAGATRAQGAFSLNVEGCHVPLSDPAAGEIAGALTVHSVDLAPGPLLNEIGLLLDLVRQSQGKPPRGAEQFKVAKLKRESVVPYRMVNGRVYHENLELQFDDVTVTTHGSVGLDESLAVLAKVTAPKAFAGVPSLRQNGLEVTIRGTFARPQIDRSRLSKEVAAIVAQQTVNRLGGDKLKDAIDAGRTRLFDGLDKQLNKIFQPRK